VIKVIDILDEYLLQSEESWQRRSHYASDANACVRQLVHKWRGDAMSNPPTPGDILKWRMGAAAESIIYAALDYAVSKGIIADYDNQVKREIEVPGLAHPVVVKMDAMIHSAEGEPIGLEIKSMFGRGIINIQRTGMPKEENMVQVFFYLAYGGHQRHVLAYVGRDFGYRTEFLIERTEEGGLLCNGQPYPMKTMEYFIERFKRIEDYLNHPENEAPRDYIHAIKNGELVDEFQSQKVKYKSDWQCAYCPWKTGCWEEVRPTYRESNNAGMFAARAQPPAEQEGQG
jgi:hypothetical protein